jgi:hypothetical protein
MTFSKTFLTVSVLLCAATTHAQQESDIFHQIQSLAIAQQEIMYKVWPQVNDPKYNISFVYFTDTSNYVVNPPENFIAMANPILKFEADGIRIYKLPGMMDAAPFHMEVTVSDVPADYNYNQPFGKVSGLGQTRNFADVQVADWTGMVLHEFFHGYQFHHTGYREHALASKFIYRPINDSLQSYYKNHDWYRTSIDEENKLLLQAFEEPKKRKQKELIRKMFTLRDARRKTAVEKFNRPVDFYEKSFETMEGTARYVEAAVSAQYHTLTLPENIRQAFGTLLTTKLVAPQESPMTYVTSASQLYTYATGYNMTRVLDAIGISYKDKLFKTPTLTVEELLREACK